MMLVVMVLIDSPMVADDTYIRTRGINAILVQRISTCRCLCKRLDHLACNRCYLGICADFLQFQIFSEHGLQAFQLGMIFKGLDGLGTLAILAEFRLNRVLQRLIAIQNGLFTNVVVAIARLVPVSD